MIIDPPVWLPSVTGTIKSATAAAEPEEETPGLREKSRGFFTPTGTGLANSVVVALPRITAPARRNAATQAESRAGRCPS